jgi:glycosyltransferase involved in cell wall biosynthesis
MDSGNRSRSGVVPVAPAARQRAVVVTPVFTEGDAASKVGEDAYSYFYVYRAFADVLARWGPTSVVTRAESRLDYAIWRARQAGLEPVHLSFLPLHYAYLTSTAANVAYPFWEFPDIPNQDFACNPRNNWVRIANRLDLILTASVCTREAFVKAGVTTPVNVVPVPVREDYFEVPAWQPGQHVTLDCACAVFPQPEPKPAATADAWGPPGGDLPGWRKRAMTAYRLQVRPRLPSWVTRSLSLARRVVRRLPPAPASSLPFQMTALTELAGVVYCSILNFLCPRKNWQDLLTAYLQALADCDDATLVLKLVINPTKAETALLHLYHHYVALRLKHRCKLMVITNYLSDDQMLELARASTFYINTSRAEGACLPLQDFLAAGRPALAPRHSAMTDYFDGTIGFEVRSSPEPALWRLDPELQFATMAHRLDWQSLHDQIRSSYELAKAQQVHYQHLAAHSRQRIARFASAEAVWPRLEQALAVVDPSARQRTAPETQRPAA